MPVPDAGSEPAAWLTLDLIAGLGGENLRKLLRAFGTPAAILAQSTTSLGAVVGDKRARAIVDGADPQKLAAALKWLEGDNNHLLTLADEDYPPMLLQTADPPPLLYLKGRRELLARPAFAIVGSRNATPGGLQNAEAFAAALSQAGLTVVSGLALGIDAAAHRGGLSAKGASIAVIGTGLDLVYPSRNKALAHALATDGLIISEFSLGTPALAQNFPRRNRIISGLARGVLVVEAALASGSLITARQAGEQGRDVFAIPGSIHSPFSKGCHLLIKQGAKLVDSADDILSELGWGVPTPPQSVSTNAQPATVESESALPEEESALLKAMGFDAVSVDVLSERVSLEVNDVLTELTSLELDGRIAVLPGGKYQRLS